MRAALLTLLFVSPLLAQQPFRAGVELVTVPVTVTNRSRTAHIDGLGLSDFRIFEDGVRQDVAMVTRDALPLSICFAVDTSGSMQGVKTSLAVSALAEAARRLAPTDEISIVTFAKAARVVVPWTWASATTELSPEVDIAGETSLYDGLATALDLIEQARNRRRAIVLISDGFENNSRISLTRSTTTRRQSETSVYAFGVGSRASRFPADVSMQSPQQAPTWNPAEVDFLPLLVGDSGGTVFRIEDSGGVSRAAAGLIDDLRHQYTVGYTPQKPLDGKYRKLKVEVARPGLTVRHRRGYLALPSVP